MSGCNPFNFDAADCFLGIADSIVGLAASFVFGLPVWLIFVVAAVILGIAYRQAGWPGVGAVLFGYGVLWGKRLTQRDEPIEQLDPESPDAKPSIFKPRRTARRTPAKQRRYDPDTNSWKEVP